jgi:coenzyme F420-0:L-glutamate ligase/coenzyme F420-1:gamma-L-glutamate ligase
MPLILTPLQGIPIIHQDDDLVKIIIQALANSNIQLENGDILVLAQKIVSKVEGRLVNLSNVVPSERAMELASISEKDPRLVELILQESQAILRIRPNTIIVEHRLGFICASAGIDQSNASYDPFLHKDDEEWVLLLPENPSASAQAIREELEKKSRKKLGVMIIDSHGRAWRLGVVGLAIGFSGIPGLVDMRGKPDLFGYHLRITLIGVADELAAAASLVMGQAAEGTPVVHVRGFPYPLRDGIFKELIRPVESDMFR